MGHRVIHSGSNPDAVVQKDFPGEAVINEYDPNHCRENIVVTGPIARNQVVASNGRFQGYVFQSVKAGVTKRVGAIVRGPAELSIAKLVFPQVTNAADGPDAGTDTTAENAAATAALRAVLLADMAAAGIVVRD